MRTLLVQQLVRHAWLGGNRDIEKADDARICVEAIRMRHEYASDRSEGDVKLGLECTTRPTDGANSGLLRAIRVTYDAEL